MRVEQLYAPHLLEHHNDVSATETSQLLRMAGNVEYSGSRFYNLLPLGIQVTNSLEQIIRNSALKEGFQEISLPKIQPTEPLKTTERYDSYTAKVYRLSSEFGDFCLSRTNEEVITRLVKDSLFYRHLPLSLFQFGEVFSYNTPSAGLVSTSEFAVFEAYSFHSGKDSAREKVDSYKRVIGNLSRLANLALYYVEADGGNYGNFLVKSDKGQHRLLICENGHVAECEETEEKCKTCEKPSETSRALGVAMYKVFDDFFSRKLGLTFKDNLNQNNYPFLATYGIGMSRLLYAVVEQNRDSEGIIWPISITPYDVYLIPQYHDNSNIVSIISSAEEHMESAGIKILVDDRTNAKVNSKIKTARFVGIPYMVLVTKTGLKVQKRTSHFQEDTTLEEIIGQVTKEKNEKN